MTNTINTFVIQNGSLLVLFSPCILAFVQRFLIWTVSPIVAGFATVKTLHLG